ncbi:unnamed protein product [Allacma fusca]|uniref:TGF-beta family profile domain-containing protein n=1 Tax=Allacma fusca TaxID=39272 RepID=A0A8J2PLT9_9HEXA|nr:unnamed protein product [Allacma fusca]
MFFNQDLTLATMIGTIFMLNCCISVCYCHEDTLYNRGTVAYRHQIQHPAKSGEDTNFEDIHEMQDIEDQNELHQMQDTETATLLNKEADEDSPAVVRLTHEKHHLWKLTMSNYERDSTQSGNRVATEEGAKNQSNSTSPNYIQPPVNNSRSTKANATSTELKKIVTSEGPLQQIPEMSKPGESVVVESENQILKEKNKQDNGAKPGCRSCMINSQIEASMDSESVRKMRLEVIKEQILKKLGLKEPPNTTFLANEAIPLPVALGSTLPRRRHPHFRSQDRDIDDFYGKTEQVIVFPEDVMPTCVTHRPDPSSCFTFKVPQENMVEKASTAELWVYKFQDGKDSRNQSFWVDEVSLYQTDMEHGAVRARNIEIKHDIPSREGWIKLNLTRMIPKWLASNISEHTLQIGCKTCVIDSYESPIDTEGDQRPFIVINYKSSPVKKRSRRSINCSPQLKECCRESFEVSFKEIGWDQWIIAPANYNAYFCKGSCITINGQAHSTARHTTVMQRYIGKFGLSNRTAELVPCCTATKMSPISLLLRDPENITRAIKQEILPNMVVDSCGCL